MTVLQQPWGVPALSGTVAFVLWWWLFVAPSRRAERARAAQPEPEDVAPAPPVERHWVETPAAGALAAAVAVVVWFVGGSFGLSLAALMLSQGVLVMSRARIRARRAERDERDVLEALGAAATGLRAGIPLAGVMQILAVEAQGEAGRAFREVSRREAMGQEFTAAVERVLAGSRLVALRAFGLALIVHSSAGGNLSAVADRIVRSLIDRTRMRRRARTILTYGIFAANFLALAPLLGFLFLSVQLEEYSSLMLERPIGHLLIGISAALVVIGLVTVRRISSFDRLSEGGRR